MQTVVATSPKPITSVPLHSSTMSLHRGGRAMAQWAPTCMRSVQPSLTLITPPASSILMIRSFAMDSKGQLSVFSSNFRYKHMSFIPLSQSFHGGVSAIAPGKAGTQLMLPDETEGKFHMQKEADQSIEHVSDDINPEFAECLQAFEALHVQLRESGEMNKIGLDALETSICSMEAAMSSTAPHEYWHMGSSWLKLAWLYSEAPGSIEEPSKKVIFSGHQALRFLDALQTPVWTIVSCCYVLARAYARMEKFEDALSQLKRASTMVKDLEQKLAPNPEQAQLVDALSSLMWDTKIRFGQYLCSHVREYLVGDGNSQVFLSPVTEALELVKAKVDCHSMALVAQFENCLGIFYLQSRHADEALPHFRNSLSKLTKLHGPSSSKVAIAHNHLGVAYTELCKLHDALKHFESAKAILSRCTLEKGDGTEVTLYNNIAQVYALRGRFDDALMAQKRLIEIIKQNMKDNIQTPFVLDAAEETLQEMIQQAHERGKS